MKNYESNNNNQTVSMEYVICLQMDAQRSSFKKIKLIYTFIPYAFG